MKGKKLVLSGFQLLDAGDTVIHGKIDGDKTSMVIAAAVTTEEGHWKAIFDNGSRMSLIAELAQQDCYEDGDYSYCAGEGQNEGKPFNELEKGDSVYLSTDWGATFIAKKIVDVKDSENHGWKCAFKDTTMLYLTEVQDDTSVIDKGQFIFATTPNVPKK